jgi:putative colanic acid biosynthesis glycosyltransferase WcaI
LQRFEGTVRIVFLTHYFPPEVGAAPARILRVAAGLQRRGFDVVVHTGFPHYPEGRVPAPYRNRPWAREELAGVSVLRTAVYPAPNRGFARRLADHAAFAAGAVAGHRLAGPADAVIAESPPLFAGAAGVPYAALKRAALILNVSDRWPASAVALGAVRPGPALAAAEGLELACYRAARAITVPTAPMARTLAALPTAGGKVTIMAPVVEPQRFAHLAPPPPRPGEPLRVVYAGTVGLAQGIDTLVEAARLAGPEAVELTIAGGGAELDGVRRRAPGNVRVLGVVPAARVPDLYAEADAGAVLLRDLPIFDEALPTKLLEVMAAARPVVLAGRGESAALVRAAGAGVVVPPGDAAALADALAALPADAARLGAAGRAHVEAHFTVEELLDRWVALLERVSARARSGRASAGRRRAG